MFQTPRIAPGRKELIFRRSVFPWQCFFPHPGSGCWVLSTELNLSLRLDLAWVTEWSNSQPPQFAIQRFLQLENDNIWIWAGTGDQHLFGMCRGCLNFRAISKWVAEWHRCEAHAPQWVPGLGKFFVSARSRANSLLGELSPHSACESGAGMWRAVTN